jgi:hypothetical protein
LPGYRKLPLEVRVDSASQRVSVFPRRSGRHGVRLPESLTLGDEAIQERLRRGRIVDFAVTVAPVADEIDDDVAREGVAVLERDAPGAGDGFGSSPLTWRMGTASRRATSDA